MDSGRRMESHMFTLHREPKWRTQCRMLPACSGTLSSGSTGTLGWQWHVWHHAQLLSTGLQLHCGLCFTLLLPKEFGRENREHLLESSPSARADPAYSLLAGLSSSHVCNPVLCRPTCVQSFHSQPSVTSLWDHKRGVPLHSISVL